MLCLLAAGKGKAYVGATGCIHTYVFRREGAFPNAHFMQIWHLTNVNFNANTFTDTEII